LKISAKDEGAWSANVTVEVQAGSLTNSFTLLVNYKGLQVEKYTNLLTPAAAVNALLTSAYVRGTDLGSVTVAPGNNPAVVAATALSAGSDDRGSVTASTHIASLNRITADFGPGVCAIPGQAYTATATGLAAHAVTNGRIALTAPAVGTSVAGASTAARGIRTIGSWQPPAGHYGGAQFAANVELPLTAANLNSLTDDAVSPIRLSSTGPRLADWRSISGDENDYRFLSVMDELNDIAFQCDQKLEPFEMLTIDGQGQLLTHVYNEIKSVVAPIAAAGGLYAKPNGTPPDPGYLIDVGPTVNTPATLALGQLRVAVQVRPPGVAELIRFFLTSVTLSADL
jgi:hypothetical protein